MSTNRGTWEMVEERRGRGEGKGEGVQVVGCAAHRHRKKVCISQYGIVMKPVIRKSR